MADLDPLDVPLLGHFGLLDTLNHALSAAGAYASLITRGSNAPDDVAGLRQALERADAVSSLARDALLAGATREQRLGTEMIDPDERAHWLARHADQAWTEAEIEVLRRIGAA